MWTMEVPDPPILMESSLFPRNGTYCIHHILHQIIPPLRLDITEIELTKFFLVVSSFLIANMCLLFSILGFKLQDFLMENSQSPSLTEVV